MTSKEAVNELRFESEHLHARIAGHQINIDHLESEVRFMEERMKFIKAKIHDIEKGR